MDKETKKEFNNLAKIIKKGFDEVDQRFEKVDQRFEGVERRFEGVDQRFERIDQRFEGIESRLDNMVTKEEHLKTKLELMDHIEEKAADVKGSLVVSIRQGDRKLNRLIEILKNKKHLTNQEEKELIKIRPFSEVGQSRS